jgi:hypothetical protein
MSSVLGIIASSMKGVSGSYESIAKDTPVSVNNVTFNSIPSTYKHLQIRYSVKGSSGGLSLYMQLNADTGSNYSYHVLNGYGTAATAEGYANQSQNPIGPVYNGTSTTYQTVGIVDIHDYASTNINKTVRTFAGQDSNGSGDVDLLSFNWRNTNAVTSIKFYVPGAATFVTGSTVSLYGIKG